MGNRKNFARSTLAWRRFAVSECLVRLACYRYRIFCFFSAKLENSGRRVLWLAS